MSHLSIVCFSRRALLRTFVSLAIGLGVAACHHGHDGDKPPLQGAPAGSATTQPASASGKTAFALVSASSETSNSRTALTLHFNATLASAQAFDTLIAVTGPNGEVVSGSWSLQGRRQDAELSVRATEHSITPCSCTPACWRRMAARWVMRSSTTSIPATCRPAIGFASHGSVLPARGTRGLPLVSMNVHDADVEFFRVHDDALSDLFCAYPANSIAIPTSSITTSAAGTTASRATIDASRSADHRRFGLRQPLHAGRRRRTSAP